MFELIGQSLFLHGMHTDNMRLTLAHEHELSLAVATAGRDWLRAASAWREAHGVRIDDTSQAAGIVDVRLCGVPSAMTHNNASLHPGHHTQA